MNPGEEKAGKAPSAPDAAPARPIRLIAGLGNPGKKYEGTRHNIGFEVVDELARRAGVKFKKQGKWKGEAASAEPLALLKPLTFMNLSGQSVAPMVRFYKWHPEQILVIYDDLAIPLGKLRLRYKGSAGGHNGLKSIIAEMGTEEIPRLRVGIGAAEGEGGLVPHVLGKFSPEEEPAVKDAILRAADAVEHACNKGFASAMNAYN